ncbi:hypothetical protein BZA05DRAFT_75535 [Tricharina praecox]|uniref:uncharacterized protein n=1 Tax=Tricharina praecox TaxID=43433 RepID=UPI002220A3C9|nr:uncharacterized protein BZA05DRAFT_75535 [Tricharina praecox]KAI5849733.1 hypothetical protein BZA05DRAFT_75535 [Tricharina praecox]
MTRLTQERDEAAKEVTELKQSVATLETRIAAITAEKERLEVENKQISEEVQASVKSLESVYTAQIEDLDRTVASQREKITDLEKRFLEGDATSAGLADELDRERLSKGSISKELEAAAREAATAEAAKADLAHQLEALREQLAAISAAKEQAIAEEKAAKKAVESQLVALSEEFSATKSASEGAVTKLQSVEQELAASKAAKENTAREVEELMDQLSDVKASKDAAAGGLSALAVELEQVKKDKEAALQAVQADLEDVRAQLKAAVDNHESTQAKLVELSKENEKAVSAALETVQAERLAADKTRKALEEKLEDLETTLKEKVNVLTKLAGERDEYEHEIPTLKQKLALAESMVNEKQAAIQNVRNEYESKVKVLEAELSEARIAATGSGAGPTNGAGDAEVSTRTGDAGGPRSNHDGVEEENDALAIVRYPLFCFMWIILLCCLLFPNTAATTTATFVDWKRKLTAVQISRISNDIRVLDNMNQDMQEDAKRAIEALQKIPGTEKLVDAVE